MTRRRASSETHLWSESAQRGNVAAASTSFLGREDELRALTQLVEGDARVVTIVGPPGVGKSRLAVEFALAWRTQDPTRSAWWSRCQECATEGELVVALATTLLAAAIDHTRDLRPIVGVLSHGRPTLVVLDNVEKLAGRVTSLFEEITSACPNVVLVCTSREPVCASIERRFQVEPLTRDHARRLFIQRAAATRGRELDVAVDAPHIDALVERLDRFPLAIELAASRAHVLSTRQLLAKLTERFRLLAPPKGDKSLGHAHNSLRETLDWSWELLTPHEAAALQQCTVFRDGFSLEAAEAVICYEPAAGENGASDGTRDAPWTLDILHALYDRSLLHVLRPHGESEDARYALYESVRDYAAEKLSADDRAAAEQRHADYFIERSEFWAAQCTGAQEVDGLRAMVAERSNMLAVVERWLEREPTRAACMVMHLDALLRSRGPFQQMIDLYDALFERLDVVRDRTLVLRLRCRRAFELATRGRLDAAREDLKVIDAVARPDDNAQARFDVCHARGVIHLVGRALDPARASLTEALEIAEHAQLELSRGRALLFIGMLHSAIGDNAPAMREDAYERAHEAYREALATFQARGSQRFISAILGNIGNLYARLDRRGEQQHYYEAALEYARPIGHRFLEGAVTANLANLAVHDARHDDATRLLERALALQREVGRINMEAFVLMRWGVFDMDAARWDDATARLLDALELCRAGRDHAMAFETLWLLGTAQLGAGHRAHALEWFQAASDTSNSLEPREDASARPLTSRRALAAAGIYASGGDRAQRIGADTTEADLEAAPPGHTPSAAAARDLLAALGELQRGDAAARMRVRHRLHAQWQDAETEQDPPISLPAEVRVLVRLVRDALKAWEPLEEGHEARAPQDTPASRAAAQANAAVVGVFRVAEGAQWFEPPHGARVEIHRRRVVRRLLRRLVDERAAAPGNVVTVRALVRAAWPGQQFVADSAANRVYVAISSLRKLGLEEVIVTTSGGYRLDPHIPLEIVP